VIFNNFYKEKSDSDIGLAFREETNEKTLHQL